MNSLTITEPISAETGGNHAEPQSTLKVASAESAESKESKRGGKRPGAGRKPNIAKRLARQVTHATAGQILSSLDSEAMFRDIFKNGSRPLKLQAWIALNDRYFGKPKQDVGVSGGLVHAHVWRPLSALNDEEIALLDKLTKKLSAPVSNASPDAHQNQIESKPALDAEVMGLGSCPISVAG